MSEAILRDDRRPINNLHDDFRERLLSLNPTEDELEAVRTDYGGLPEDVIEQLARQKAAAKPVLEQYHLLAENAPTLAIARATMQKDIDLIADFVTGMDLGDLSDETEWEDEYTCPKCAHTWSGAPNYRTGYGGKVFVPTGTVSTRTGRLQSKSYNAAPPKGNSDFPYARNWRGAKPQNLPRGFGNRPVTNIVVGSGWGRRRRRIE